MIDYIILTAHKKMFWQFIQNLEVKIKNANFAILCFHLNPRHCNLRGVRQEIPPPPFPIAGGCSLLT